MDGIDIVHTNNIYAGQVGDESFVYPDDLYFGGIASLGEPVQIRFVIGNVPVASMQRMVKNKIRRRILQAAWPERSVGNPFLDGLPGWLDGLHGFDIEGRRWRAGKMNDAFPEAVEAEEEFNLAGTQVGATGFKRYD